MGTVKSGFSKCSRSVLQPDPQLLSHNALLRKARPRLHEIAAARRKWEHSAGRVSTCGAGRLSAAKYFAGRALAWRARTQNLGKPGNRALADAVAAREFGKRSTLRPSPPGLGLLRRRQFRRTAHGLPDTTF